MYLRSLAITVSLAAGLLVLLAMAFVTCIPTYLLSLMQAHEPRVRVLRPAPSVVRLSRS